jgi:hypothetical protein
LELNQLLTANQPRHLGWNKLGRGRSLIATEPDR